MISVKLNNDPEMGIVIDLGTEGTRTYNSDNYQFRLAQEFNPDTRLIARTSGLYHGVYRIEDIPSNRIKATPDLVIPIEGTIVEDLRTIPEPDEEPEV